ncbi:polysaccharide deacetylase family protein [Neotamlana laminarinivorans]|uniref:Polysaccharide deacetylase family protein n=1 Tax=Neotamlana laminarinivorans TaxID=2883124 RepID=A0A9X1I446_9FLAO|nr:polysaccharide deacetylase family protein [Tamlana laminarinivorans]MCB4799862.1 polysaccharide deacetylase family protein [Tamlana laminarinivorans]
MNIIPIKTPLVVKKIFSKYIWDIPTTKRVLYLTFDDGPTPEITHWVLKTLKQYQAKATFFCIGNNVEKHPEILKDIITEGHIVGNHTHNHLKGWKTSKKLYLENTLKAQKTISSVFDTFMHTSNLFRPPYGKITNKQGKKLLAIDYKIIMWDVISFDWDKNITPETCLNNVIKKAKSGSIIVFHDSVKAQKNMTYALPKVLEHFYNLGFTFEAINFN